jgi:hypothetical protein
MPSLDRISAFARRVAPRCHASNSRFASWTEEDWAFAFEERAAILEYDGGHSREEAERLARAEIEAMRREDEAV